MVEMCASKVTTVEKISSHSGAPPSKDVIAITIIGFLIQMIGCGLRPLEPDASLQIEGRRVATQRIDDADPERSVSH